MIWTKKTISILLVLMPVLCQLKLQAQSYMGKTVKVSIFSSTPIEDIRAASEKGSAVLVIKTQEIAVQVPVKSLEFERKLMQEHFNENYMESDKYPMARFKGIIQEQIDFTKDGDYDVNVSGILSVHGVDKKRSVPGKISIRNGVIQISTEFKVPCADHQIKIPKLVFTKIAEVIHVKVEGKLNQLK